jgi:hypothetical protein
MLKTISSITNALGALNYKGTWNALTNSPTLADGTGAKGDYYVVSTAGTQTFGGVQLFFGIGDWIAYNGAVWQRVEGGSDGNFANVTLTSTDAGATAAPLLDLYRDSASPAASDTLGEIEFNGEDSAGNKQTYGVIHASILSPTSTAEQGQLHFETATAGALTEKMIIGTSNLVINEIGAVFNVRIEGDTDANLFYTDATNSRVGMGTITPAQKLDIVGNIRMGTNTNGGSGDEFANLEFYWGDPDAAEVKAKIYGKNVGNVGPGGGGAADLLLATTPAFGALTERFRWTADGKVLSLPIYNTTVGATNRDVFVDNTGLIGYVSSTRESKTNISEMGDVSWLSALQPVTFNRRKKEPIYGGENGTAIVGEQYSSEHYNELEYGLIADEAESVNSELCFYDIVDGVKVLRGIHYSKLIVPLLKRVQQLEADLAALKGA